MKKTILILGKGFIGTELSNYFDTVDMEYEIYSRSMLDYTNEERFREFLSNNESKYYAIISAFGYTGRPNVDGCESNKEDCWNFNVMYPLGVVKVANEFKLPVIHVSSGCIYNGYEKHFTENDKPNFGLFSNESSFYSKCKHASEIMLDGYCVYILRIRIPFTATRVPKNYFTKLYNYNDLIDMPNSVTSVYDLNNFIFRMLYLLTDLPGGIYNVVNPQPIKASEVVDLMKKYGVENPNWNFIDVKDLNTVANRSNCILDTAKIQHYNLPLPNTLESIERDIKVFKGYF
jgi:dTDP-4-dehydrorhamnose reductase